MNYNVTGSDRQRMVGIISRELGVRPVYHSAPTFTYTVSGITVGRRGELSWDDNMDNATIHRVIDALAEAGFQPEEPADLADDSSEPYTGEELTAAEMSGLTIRMPLDGFDPDSIDRLQKLVDSKASLIEKSVGAQSLMIRISEDKVEFPWWGRLPSPEETQAYIALITALCTKAKECKRVTAKDREVESEKFAFRVFLLSLGFVGTEYKQVRGILMKNLSGSAAFPTKAAADEFSAKQKAKRAAGKTAREENTEEA